MEILKWRRLGRAWGIDRAVILATLTTVVPLLFGPVTAVLVATRFTPELQGYYYTFGSLTALQFLAELGLGQAVIQFASHEWSRLAFAAGYRIEGEAASLSRLRSLSRFSLQWYGIASIAVMLILAVGGLAFFSHNPSPTIQWRTPWLTLCVLLGFNLTMTPLFYLLQGCNEVSAFWFYRLIQQVVNGLALWIAIFSGVQLWALPFAAALSLLWSSFFVWRYRNFFRALLAKPTGPRIAWRQEVWPVQWRIAITWLSTYFTSQLFTPILFRVSGPVVAGQMGMTNTLSGVVTAMSSNWVVTKAPRFGVLIAGRKWRELDRVFFRSLYVSMFVAASLAATAWLLIYALNQAGHSLATRILPPLPAALFLSASVISSALASMTIYLRAHKREPLMIVFLAGALLTAGLTVLTVSRLGAVGAGLSYLAALTLFQLPITLVVFWRSRATWHGQTVDEELEASADSANA